MEVLTHFILVVLWRTSIVAKIDIIIIFARAESVDFSQQRQCSLPVGEMSYVN